MRHEVLTPGELHPIYVCSASPNAETNTGINPFSRISTQPRGQVTGLWITPAYTHNLPLGDIHSDRFADYQLDDWRATRYGGTQIPTRIKKVLRLPSPVSRLPSPVSRLPSPVSRLPSELPSTHFLHNRRRLPLHRTCLQGHSRLVQLR
jgi:hypothetical protein